jgi:uncharacterized protein (DUF2252 family)
VLERVESGALPEGPAIWICGDCHVGNLGPVGNARRKIEIQIRDLDQTVIGNPAHDPIRVSLSLASAARGSDLPGLTTVKMLERIMDDYHMPVDSARQAHLISLFAETSGLANYFSPRTSSKT